MKLNVIASSSTINNQTTLDQFVDDVTNTITDAPTDAIICFPEYSWGKTKPERVLEAVDLISSSIKSRQQVILGTYLSTTGYNEAIYINGQLEKYFVRKTRVLKDEKNQRKVNPGINQGIINFKNTNILILICSDMWDSRLLLSLLNNKRVDLIAVPAFTIVPKGLGNYARYQWYSLGIVRSREFIVPIVIADHATGGESYDVGAATCIINPSLKNSDIQSTEDFLVLPSNSKVEAQINLAEVRKYLEYRLDKGLYS